MYPSIAKSPQPDYYIIRSALYWGIPWIASNNNGQIPLTSRQISLFDLRRKLLLFLAWRYIYQAEQSVPHTDTHTNTRTHPDTRTTMRNSVVPVVRSRTRPALSEPCQDEQKESGKEQQDNNNASNGNIITSISPNGTERKSALWPFILPCCGWMTQGRQLIAIIDGLLMKMPQKCADNVRFSLHFCWVIALKVCKLQRVCTTRQLLAESAKAFVEYYCQISFYNAVALNPLEVNPFISRNLTTRRSYPAWFLYNRQKVQRKFQQRVPFECESF